MYLSKQNKEIELRSEDVIPFLLMQAFTNYAKSYSPN
jgi:hypothetical protein